MYNMCVLVHVDKSELTIYNIDTSEPLINVSSKSKTFNFCGLTSYLVPLYGALVRHWQDLLCA